MFLSSLKKVANTSLPKKYVERKERGYNIRGNIDIEAFVNRDLLMFDQKITYTYSERIEIQSIIDVLYTALKSCQINGQNDILPSIQNLKAYICEHYSGIRPSQHVINNIDKDRSLFNSLYAGFKRPLELAKIIIKHDDLNPGETQKVDRPSGFLVDASFLWEMYVYNLMTIHLPEWNIEAQSVISFYDSTFFSKKNYPDFVLTNRKTGKIFVLDAKFKRMKYENIDVDNEDIRQLHSYSYYYSLRENEKFGGAALIYPSKMFRPNKVKHTDFLFGEENSNARFGVFSIKDPSIDESIVDNEERFIAELKAFLEGN
jgi:5-methylcytosine-specific restriction endonuclease McrBC regulatory subunit McrC